MLKNNKLKLSFSTESILILVAFLFQIIPDIVNNDFGNILGVFLNVCYYSVYLLLFIAFGMYYTEAKGGILFSIAFFIKFAFVIESFIFNYIVYDNPINVFYLVIDVACAISNIVFVLYGLNKIKNMKICYIFIGLLLLDSSVYFIESVIGVINSIRYSYFTFYNCGWLLSEISYLLIHVVVLIDLLPSKKKKYIENKKTIEAALKTLKEDFENNLITEDEYLSKKKEYINNL